MFRGKTINNWFWKDKVIPNAQLIKSGVKCGLIFGSLKVYRGLKDPNN